MTPKKKAKELFDRYYDITGPFTESKQCALIAVDELVKYTHSDFRGNSPMDKEYWQQVKQEIEKL